MVVYTRNDVLDAAAAYYDSTQAKEFVPGETFIPCSGKVVDSDDLRSLVDASLDMWLTTGRYGDEFEKELALKTGIKHARLTVSGSAANLLAFSSLTSWKLQERRIQPGDEVITVAAGFPTTVTPIVQNGCVPVFVDVDLPTANIDVSLLEAALTPKTRAIMLAHTLGNPFDLQAVSDFCRMHNLYLVEDCCDALGITFNGKGVGRWGIWRHFLFIRPTILPRAKVALFSLTVNLWPLLLNLFVTGGVIVGVPPVCPIAAINGSTGKWVNCRQGMTTNISTLILATI